MPGPDIEAIIRELHIFIAMTEELAAEGGFGFMETRASKEEILGMLAVIDPILNRFYPTWQVECPMSSLGRWRQRREAVIRCIARIESQDRLASMLGDDSPELSASSFHPWVWEAARPQWGSRHFGEAVGAAARNVNSHLQAKLDRRNLSDSKLVRETFSLEPAATGRPRLRLIPPEDSEGYRTLQEGVASFGAGCFQAIRNPVAHDPEVAPEMDEQLALERLAAFSALARWIDSADLEAV